MNKTMTDLERDSFSRRRIVSETDTNFFVEAGAGSGKTTMLVRRMAAMVEAGTDISRICAITFTKAAAGEFYDRFRRLLTERSNPEYRGKFPEQPGQLPEPTEESRARCREALQNIDLCFMGTIDAFCSMVLSEHPAEAGIPSDVRIVSDTDAAALYRQQYVKISSGDCGRSLQSAAKTFQALHGKAQDVFARGMLFIMNNRNVRFHFHEECRKDIDRVFDRQRGEVLRCVKCLTEHPELKYEGNKKSRDAWEKIEEVYRTLCGRWSRNYTNVLYGMKTLGDLRLVPEAMKYHARTLGSLFSPGGKRGSWLECSVGQEGGLLEKLQKYQYDFSMTFLTECVSVMEHVLRERGTLTFFDYLYYLRNMLRKDAERDGRLIRYIHERHSYYLIDEFQDTNPMQAEIFFYLSSAHPVPQWSACVPRPGSLFIVGDPKQSVYRFRSADVSSFLKVKRLFEKNGGEVLKLSRNFRSRRVLCSYYNRVFSALMPEETDNQSSYENIPLPSDGRDEFEGIFTYKAYTGQAASDFPDRTDPVRIADIIEGLVGRREFMLCGRGGRKPRCICYSDFMVITYGKKALGPIKAELDLRGIPTLAEGDVPFAENQALREICCIYCAVTDREDSLSLYGALTGKLIALSKEEILKYKSCGGQVSLKGDPDSEISGDAGAASVCKELKRLKKLQAETQRLTPAALFEKIMDDYRIYEFLPAENLEVVCYALELLRNAEKSGQIITLKDGGAYLGSLIAGDSGEERCLSLTADADAVHMANLHKVKGLEAPIVILAAASDAGFPAAYRILHEDSGSEGYIFSLESGRDERGKREGFFSTKDFPDEKSAEEAALKAESDRLLYVAATRAENVLILCNGVSVRDGRENSKSRWKPLMEPGLVDIFEKIGDVRASGTARSFTADTETADAAELYQKAEAESILNNRSPEEATFALANPSRLRVRSWVPEPMETETAQLPAAETEAEDSEKGEQGTVSERRRFAALRGTMIHKLLEIFVTTKNRIDTDAAVSGIIREFRTPETERFEEKLAESLHCAAEKIRSGGYAQSNGVPQDILATLMAADEVHTEVPFCYREETEGTPVVWNGIMDAIYCENGRWHIIDYKTNADGNDLNRRYQAQLNAYIKAFKATTGLDADARTYHIDI